MKIEALQLEPSLLQSRRFGLEGGLVSQSQAVDLGEKASLQDADFLIRGQEREKLFEAIQAADERLEELGLHVRLKIAEKSDRLQVEVYDPETEKVIRRFPPDEIIKLAESIEEMAGVILDRSL